MKINFKKILNGILIFVITVVSGFAITAGSFNLFERLSVNEMKILFGIDILLLIACGGFFFYLSEKRNKLNQKEYKKNKFSYKTKTTKSDSLEGEKYKAA